ncbi:predicted protein [Verticillium alfalfae VaMs.102]|uniref:Predicted protein n=1 Tax=Verticillium alfalfae (strain VaMs.102 / ATCC MYA-4576 / FGSC 10136) TaxID=526221 RepID=C9S809_VERA1|nr:predicted protein [Verticillium alfalfae VaMs.102]EEY15299.1 predicted protein [Verticillium alfalfae VaMs.102]
MAKVQESQDGITPRRLYLRRAMTDICSGKETYHPQEASFNNSYSPDFSLSWLLRFCLSGSEESADEMEKPLALNPDERRAVIGLDYFTWQENIPKEFPRNVNLDNCPGDPVECLFNGLPPILIDDSGVSSVGRDSDMSAMEYDRRFAHAVWPFANSDLRNLLHTSDPMILPLWQVARSAFSVYEQNNNTIRNAFMQGLAQLRDQTPQVGKTNQDAAGNAPISNKVKWIAYCAWIAAGRADHVAPIPDRRFAKNSMDIELTSHRGVCAFCGAKPFEEQPVRGPAPRIVKCSGCYVDELPNITQQYCDCTCSKKDWKDNHYYACRQRCGFLRSAFLLRNMADMFMKASYSGISSVHIRDYPDFESTALKPGGPLDSTGPTRISAPDACCEEVWTGGSVFPQKYLDAIDESPAWAARLAQDAGDDYLRHLHGIIIDTLHGTLFVLCVQVDSRLTHAAHCSQVVEMYVYARNAGTVLHLGTDYHKENGNIQAAKGKNPMFWPHPVLFCKLKPTGYNDKGKEWIIDLHCAKYGWKEYVLPFDAYFRTRVASSFIARAFKEAPEHWCPWEEKGRRRARYNLGHYIHNAIIKFMHDTAKLKVPFEMTRVKDVSEWKKLSKAFLDVFEKAALEGAQKIRQSATHRQFLYYQHNSYGPEYGVGVTNNKVEVSFFNPIWLTPEQWAEDFSELEMILFADQSPGALTRYGVCRWIKRVKARAEHHDKMCLAKPDVKPFDYEDLIGNMTKYFDIGEGMTLEHTRAIVETHLIRDGTVPEADLRKIVDEEIRKGALHNSDAADMLRAGPSAKTTGSTRKTRSAKIQAAGDAKEDSLDGESIDSAEADRRAKKNKKKREKKKAKKAAAKDETAANE